MNELINTLEKAKAQGRNVILSWEEDGVETVCIQEEYAEYYLDGMLTFKEESECGNHTGQQATHPDVVLKADKEVFTFNLCQDCLEKF
jgi:hypothetical protein